MSRCFRVLLAVILIFGIMPVFAAGSVYYIDAVLGDDQNSGLSPELAWKTVSNVNTNVFVEGDSILFKRGQSWQGVSINFGYSGSSSSARITFGAYGEGERPILSGAIDVSNWQHHSGSVYSLSSPAGETPYFIVVNGEVIKRITSTTDPASVPINKYIYTNGTIYYNSPNGISPNDFSTPVQVQTSHNIFFLNQRKYITIQDLHLTLSGGAAILMDGSKNWGWHLIAGNEISYIESAYTSDAAIKGSGTQNSVISNNVIHDVYGDGIMLWNASGNTVRENHISRVYAGVNNGSDGIQVSGKYADSAPNNKIINNYVSMQGTDSPKGCIIYERGDNAHISGNTVLYGHFGIETDSNNALVENNFCAYQGVEGSALNWTAGLYSSEDLAITGMVWRNNIIYGSKPNGINIVETSFPKNINFYNNTVYDAGVPFRCSVPYYGEIKNNIFWGGGDGETEVSRAFVLNTVSGSVVMDNNLIGPEVFEKFVTYDGNSFNTLSNLKTITGQNLNSTTMRPLFVNPANGDFRLFSNSPGVNGGVDVGITTDQQGEAAYQDGGFNMGALATTEPTDEPPPEPPPPEPVPEDKYVDGLLLYEGFDYTPTSELAGAGESSMGWSGAWNAGASSSPAKIGTDSMPYDGINSVHYKGMYVVSISRKIDPSVYEENGTYWISLISRNNSSSRETIISIGNKIKLRQPSGGLWLFTSPSNNKPVDLGVGSYNKSNLLLLKVELFDSQTKCSIWVNPTLESDEAGLGSRQGGFDIGERIDLASFSASFSTGNTVYGEIDEIKIANSFSAIKAGTIAKSNGIAARALKLYADDVEVTTHIDPTVTSLTAKAFVHNGDSKKSSDTANFITVYYKEDEMLYADLTPLTMSTGEFGVKDFNVNMPNDILELSNKVAVYIWDGQLTRPLCRGAQLEIISGG